MVLRSRTFDGKRYHLHESHISSKLEARRQATRLRKMGNKARVISHGAWYSVYYR